LLINLTACSQLEQFGANLRAATNTPLVNPSLPATFTPTVSATAFPPIPATPAISAGSQQSALLPEYAADADAFPNATRYDIKLDVDFPPGSAQAQIEGIARIRFVNPLEQNLSNIVLMLWPNDDQFQARIHTGAALIEGQLAIPKSILDGKALRLDLRPSLAPGESVDLSIPFSLEIGTIHELAPKRMGISNGVLIAPAFYPLIPRLVDSKWDTYAASSGGNTTPSEVAFYSVRIMAPESLAVIATGVENERTTTPEGKQQIDFLSGPVRDFAFAIGPLARTSRTFAGITLNTWTLHQHNANAQTILQAAGIQVELLGEIVGPYPYQELDLVDAPHAIEGIASPGLVFVGSMGTNWVIESTVRDVAHQWFSGLLGNDPFREPWLDEATASFATALYYERAYGLGQGTGYLSDIRAILRSHPDSMQPIGLNVDGYQNESDFPTFIQLKGALFLEALRNKMGSYRFNTFLSSLFTQYRYAMIGAEDFQDTAEAICACDLQDLFDLWVYEGGEVFPP